MQRPPQTDDMQRELHATLSAMREVGPAYEDHLVESFVQKFTQQLVPQLRSQAQQPEAGPSAGQRLALAIVSLCLMLPMSIAIISIMANRDSGTYGGITATLVTLILICGTVLGVNYLFNRRH